MLDPKAIALRNAVAPRYQLKLHEISPERIVPNGDRYVVEVIDIDENVELGQFLVVAQQPQIDPRDPKADPNIEKRGVLAGVIISAGNGHLLGIPDHALMSSKTTSGVTWPKVVREKADVPMFYVPGDVVFVDHNARGRALRIVGREVRIVNQIDVLGCIEGIRLKRVDGAWVPEA